MKYRNIGVVGAGVIGVEVAQSLAQTGHCVVLVDISEEILQRARTDIRQNIRLAALFDATLRQSSHEELLSRIELTTDHARLTGVEFVVENTTESWPVKELVYPVLDRVCPPECILAANTSAISISRLAAKTQRPDRVIGMHFMNPVPQKPVVEVVKAAHTSEETLEGAKHLLQQMGKKGIVVKDMPGFVSNRVLMLTINEAISVVQDNVAGPRDVDEIFVKCFGHKMGPLATADLIGLDTVLLTLDVLFDSYNDSKYRACSLLQRMVHAGLLGRKTGKGFFDHCV